jgi:hypothetical protein
MKHPVTIAWRVKMRNFSLIFLLLLLLSSVRLCAQESYAINKGSWSIGGFAGFTSSGSETLIEIQPFLSFFLIPNFSIGGTVHFERHSYDWYYSNTTLTIGPRLAYYFGDKSSNVYPFASVGFNTGELSELGLAGGVAFMIARNVAITSSAVIALEERENTFGVLIGISTFIY